MIHRCTNPKVHERKPYYIGCHMSENFKDFDFFAEWCNLQKGFDNEDYQLDKDLLVKGNKCYSEETCVFLPRRINQALTTRKADRGELPLGVTWSGISAAPYLAKCRTFAGNESGNFETPEEAFMAYKWMKEKYMAQLAYMYKDSIDIRAVQALCNYQVDIND